jgi:hypothetical protein
MQTALPSGYAHVGCCQDDLGPLVFKHSDAIRERVLSQELED